MEASRAVPVEVGGVRQVVADYVALTKPRVQLLLLLTTVTTMYVAGDPSPALVLLTCLGGSLSAGGAAAVNHYYDRDIDAQMARTATRPVPSGRVRPGSALAYGLGLQALSFALLATTVNLPVAFGFFGAIYAAAAVLLGGAFLVLAVRLQRRADRQSALRTYLYSLAYLALLFGAMVVDARL